MKDRIYVCHTFYHVYISFLKELALPGEEQGKATLCLSKMSNDFGDLKERLLSLHYFEDVLEFDEKRRIFSRSLQNIRLTVEIFSLICFTGFDSPESLRNYRHLLSRWTLNSIAIFMFSVILIP